jgi:hypothetical protein
VLVFDCCRVTALHAPRDWAEDLSNTQVKLVEVQGKTYDQILREKLDGRFERLERESLLVKASRLFARSNPGPGWSPMANYTYEVDRVRKFDDQRHAIVHGKTIGSPLTIFELSDDNLDYIQRTGLYFLGLANHKYGLRLHPRRLEKSMWAKLRAPER